MFYKLSNKYDIMIARSNQTEEKESEKALYVNQIKGKCYNCGKYGDKSRDCTERKENKSCTYWEKDGHVIE